MRSLFVFLVTTFAYGFVRVYKPVLYSVCTAVYSRYILTSVKSIMGLQLLY